MNCRRFSSFIFIVGLGFLAGCQTVDDRIGRAPESFASVDQATQDKIKQGIIDLGFSENMVYLALGAPAQKRKSVSATGETVTWIYYASSELRADILHDGYYRHYYDPNSGDRRTVHIPATFENSLPEKKERIHVIFRDGKVSMIEQTQNGTNVGLPPGSPVRVSARGS